MVGSLLRREGMSYQRKGEDEGGIYERAHLSAFSGGVSRCNPGAWVWEMRVSDFLCYIGKQTECVFLMITVCCSSHPDPSLLLVSRLVYDLVP